MIRKLAVALASLTAVVACADLVTPPRSAPSTPVTAKSPAGSGGRYKLRLIYGVNSAGDGELQSTWFPDSGVTINVRSPWKSLTVTGATIDLVNFTHGSWSAGTCATFTTTKSINYTNWDIAGTDPALSFAGTWDGTFSTSQSTGTSVYFDGDRVINGATTPSAGGIHNLVTNANQAYESKDQTGSNDWFQLEVRNAAMKFGSASSPDGVSNPTGVEVACANFTVLAKKTSLITP
jgi:hypothetical protein